VTKEPAISRLWESRNAFQDAAAISAAVPRHTRASGFFVDGIRVPLNWDEPDLGGQRWWFVCRCGRRCRLTLLSPSCRTRLRIEASASIAARYPSRYAAAPASWPRPASVRTHREASARYRRYQRLVARILIEEQTLLDYLQTVTRDLDRRILVRRLQLSDAVILPPGEMTTYGCARVSTTGQTLATQRELLEAAGVERTATASQGRSQLDCTANRRTVPHGQLRTLDYCWNAQKAAAVRRRVARADAVRHPD
jgi:hypothetical protein